MKKWTNSRLIAIGMVIASVAFGCAEGNGSKTDQSIKEAFSDFFQIGVAMNTEQILGDDKEGVGIILKHFNSIVAENCMKSEVIQPNEGEFDFALADKLVEFGVQNNMHMVGHTLIWHSQAPAWFFVDDEGNDVSREVLIDRMRTHIHTVVGRYKGKIHGWDVVNEVIESNGEWRNSKFYQIIGKDYVDLAFQFAHEADPDAELYYNDFGMAIPERRNGVISMVKGLQERGIKIHGVGMQGHVHLGSPTIDDFETSIKAFSELGVTVMITEMDITVLPSPSNEVTADVSLDVEYYPELNPYPDFLPDSVSNALNSRYLDFFKLFLKHHDKISRVTLWGVHDNQTWRNYWPVRGRTDYPLLFDRNFKPKPAVQAIIDEANALSSK